MQRGTEKESKGEKENGKYFTVSWRPGGDLTSVMQHKYLVLEFWPICQNSYIGPHINLDIHELLRRALKY